MSNEVTIDSVLVKRIVKIARNLPEETTYEQIKSFVVETLTLIDPTKPYGTELFDALARLTITTAIEAVCMRCNPNTNKIEVLLIQRSDDDTAYPGEWHCPGSAMRPGETVTDVFKRLSQAEFWTKTTSVAHIGTYNNSAEARGHFRSEIFLCQIEGSSKGQWFPIDQLPKKTVGHHKNYIIPRAAKAFRENNIKQLR